MATILIFFLLLSVLILVHEFGHFFAAKKLGVVAEEFGLGLPPRIRRLFSWGGTEFTLNWLPIGGFVRMRGEDREDPKGLTFAEQRLDLKGAFYSQKPWKRAVILLAGVTMNLIFGIAAFTAVYTSLGIPESGPGVLIEGVAEESPAWELQKGDTINEIIAGGQKIRIKNNEHFIKIIEANRGNNITLIVERQKELLSFEVKPRIKAETPEGQGGLGVALHVDFVHYPWWKMPFLAAVTGIKEALGWFLNIVAGLGSMVSQLVVHGRLPKDVAGPVGIAYIAGNVARQGWLALVQFAGILSVNLAVVNILPIPALDGGRLLFLGIEKLRGRPVEAKKERWAHLIGYAVLISLILLATIQDLLRILSS